MLYQVRDLSPEQKLAAEILLGHPVSEDESVSIKSIGPSTVIASSLSLDARLDALKALSARFASSPSPEFGAEEEDAIVNEAMRSTRRNYRPIR